MGTADRVIRVVVAALIGILILTNAVSGVLAGILGVFAAIFLLTASPQSARSMFRSEYRQ